MAGSLGREVSSPEPIAYLWRLAGVMLVFFPVGGLLLFAGVMIGFSSPGPHPYGVFGLGRNSDDVARLCVGFVWLCVILALVWVLGRPRWPAGAIRFFTGFGLVVLALVRSIQTSDLGVGVLILSLLGFGLLVHSLVADRPPQGVDVGAQRGSTL